MDFSFLEDEEDVQPTEEQMRQYNSLQTAKGRYKLRRGKHSSWVTHQFHWLLHNCVVHPLLGIYPSKITTRMHQQSSDWLNRVNWPYKYQPRVPAIPNRWAWVKHNCFAHIAIGLLPIQAAFDFHDRTAKEMGVPGWV